MVVGFFLNTRQRPYFFLYLQIPVPAVLDPNNEFARSTLDSFNYS